MPEESEDIRTGGGKSTKQWALLGVLVLILAGSIWINWDHFQALTRGTPTGQDFGEGREGSHTSYRVPQITPMAAGFHPQVAIPSAFPPIQDAPVVSATSMQDQSSDFQLADNELVLGITIGDQSRAYPINMLTGPQREIINDVLGDIPIAATW